MPTAPIVGVRRRSMDGHLGAIDLFGERAIDFHAGECETRCRMDALRE
jgi:hypothetical protein